MDVEPLTSDERAELRRRIDAETRRRNLPQLRLVRPFRSVPTRPVTMSLCKTTDCSGISRTHRGPYAGLCDACIAAKCHHDPLD